MKVNRFKIYVTVLVLMILAIPVLAFGILNTMVSIKYETESGNQCLSIITGDDLCKAIESMQNSIGFCVLAIVLLIVFRKRIL
jgi:hypothetical protein